MPQRDQAYWQRLRHDKSSGFAALAAIGACGVTLVEVIDLMLPGPQAAHRATPFYWAMLIPFAWWAVNLASHTPRVSKTLVPACLVGPSIAIVCLIADGVAPGDDLLLRSVVALLSVILAVVGLVFYRRSLLRREGPARLTTHRGRPAPS